MSALNVSKGAAMGYPVVILGNLHHYNDNHCLIWGKRMTEGENLTVISITKVASISMMNRDYSLFE